MIRRLPEEEKAGKRTGAGQQGTEDAERARGFPRKAQDRASGDAWQMNVRRKFFSARWKMPSRFSRREHT